MLACSVEVARRDFSVGAELAVAPGEVLALFGPSGAGKTTIVEVLAGLTRPDAGWVRLAGRLLTANGRHVVPPHARRVALLRQEPAVFPHLDVAGNLGYAGASAVEIDRVAGLLGLEPLLAARPAALSGGQRQRVALGRALLSRHEALLLDEPFRGVDAAVRAELGEVIRAELRRRPVPAVLITHDFAEAQRLADRIAVLDRGVLHQSSPAADLLARPATRRVAELLGYQAFLPLAEVIWPGGSEARPAPLLGDTGSAPGAVLGVHPDRVRLATTGGTDPRVTGRVIRSVPAGGRWEVTVELSAGIVGETAPSTVVAADAGTTADPGRIAAPGRSGPPAAEGADSAAGGRRCVRALVGDPVPVGASVCLALPGAPIFDAGGHALWASTPRAPLEAAPADGAPR